jgi:hypothetical protein
MVWNLALSMVPIAPIDVTLAHPDTLFGLGSRSVMEECWILGEFHPRQKSQFALVQQ